MKFNCFLRSPVWKWKRNSTKCLISVLQLNKSTFKKIEENGENASEKGRATIIFSLKNEVGGLVKALKLFQVPQLYVSIKEITV